jgi:GMP synthase (glutamine-hydrolysing)
MSDRSERPRVVVVQNSERSGPGRLLGFLANEGIGAVLVSGAQLLDHPSAAALPSAARPPVARSRTRMDLPTGESGRVDGLVLLGGGLMPDDDERAPFLARERALIREAMEAGVPVLGICLGAQLLANVAGGAVTAKSGETERGSCRIELLPAAADDPLFAGLTGYDELRMIQNHEDSITTLPPEAVHLGTSQACRVQAFRVGRAAWGVQFHPEAAASRVGELDESKLAAEGFDRAELLAQAEADASINTVQARVLVGAFADAVRGAPWV